MAAVSVVIVYADGLCEDCIHHGVWESDEYTGGPRKALEMNDLCSKCAQTPNIVFCAVDPKKMPTLHNMVVRHSRWHRWSRTKRLWTNFRWWLSDIDARFANWLGWPLRRPMKDEEKS